jgi:hypothetical protein
MALANLRKLNTLNFDIFMTHPEETLLAAGHAGTPSRFLAQFPKLSSLRTMDALYFLWVHRDKKISDSEFVAALDLGPAEQHIKTLRLAERHPCYNVKLALRQSGLGSSLRSLAVWKTPSSASYNFSFSPSSFAPNLQKLRVAGYTFSVQCLESLPASLTKLIVEKLDAAIGDEILQTLPRDLITLELRGPQSHYTHKGMRALPHKLLSLALPDSTHLSQITWQEVELILPPFIAKLTFNNAQLASITNTWTEAIQKRFSASESLSAP